MISNYDVLDVGHNQDNRLKESGISGSNAVLLLKLSSLNQFYAQCLLVRKVPNVNRLWTAEC